MPHLDFIKSSKHVETEFMLHVELVVLNEFYESIDFDFMF
jgi:hypothetical protein